MLPAWESKGFWGKIHSAYAKKTSASPLPFLQALQKDKMADAYSEIGMKGEVSAAFPDAQAGFGHGTVHRIVVCLLCADMGPRGNESITLIH